MPGAFSDFIRSTLFIFGALFPIVNPLGNAPIFLTLTRGLSTGERTLLARKIAQWALLAEGFELNLDLVPVGPPQPVQRGHHP